MKQKAVGRPRAKMQVRNQNVKMDTGPTMESGKTYVTSWGTIDQSDIDSETIQKYRTNVYAKGVNKRQRFLIFTERPTVNVYDQDGNAVDELRDKVMAMGDQPEVDSFAKMQIMFDEMFWYGAGFLNPVWAREGSEVVLKKLRHLPSDSFTAPPAMAATIYSNVLPGVTIEDEETIFYQLQDLSNLNPTKVENVVMLKDPTEPGLAGSPMVLPLIAVLKMMDFAWDAQMQRINRVGAPIVFVEVTNGTADDITYAQKLLKNWGRKTSYVLKDNMRVVSVDIKESDSAMQTIDALNQLMIEFFSPASSLTKEGSLIGGSDWGASELLKSYISGIHRMIEGLFNRIYQYYLDANGYAGHTVEWKMPSMSIDRSEISLKQAQVGFNTRSLSVNEIRKRLEAEELDEEGLAKLLDEYAAMPASGGAPGGAAPMDVLPPIMNAEGCAGNDAWYNAMSNPKTITKLVRKDLTKDIDQLEEELLNALDAAEGSGELK